jgi:hypothetical protein
VKRGLRTSLVWLAFGLAMVGGAAMTTGSGPLQAWGLALLLAPVALLVGLTVAHYARQRRGAG